MNTEVMFSSKTDLWSTPQDLFDELNKEFNFQCDVCALPENAKCEYYFTPRIDGLWMAWAGRCWCNPPYGRTIGKWVKKAYEEVMRGVPLVVMLLPARTDTKWFHDYIYNKPNVEIRFIKGRLKFGDSKNSAPFPSMVVVFKGKKKSNVVDSIIDGCIKECDGLEEMIRTYEDAREMLKTAEKEGTDFSKCKTFSELCIHGAISSIGKMFKTE